MDSFGLLENGEFKGKKGMDILLDEKFAKARPLKTFGHKELKQGQKINTDVIFLVGDQKYTLKNITNEIKKVGFIVISPNKHTIWYDSWAPEEMKLTKVRKYIQIAYTTYYYI